MGSEKGAAMTHGSPLAPPPVVAPPASAPVPIHVGFGNIHQSNPPLEQLPNLQFCLHSNPSWPEAVMLAFQHYVVMLGTIVMLASFLVPQMGGNNGDKARVIQTLVFMSGVNTLLQTLIGTRLPTVMNSSFVFIIPVMSIIRDFASRTYDDEHQILVLLQRFIHTMRAIQGSLMISSFTNIFLGYTYTWERLFRFCSPVTVVPVVCVVGLGLFERGFPQVGKCVEIGLPALILLMLLITAQQYIHHNHMNTYFLLERFSIILCVKVVWAFAAVLTAAGAYNHVPEKTKLHCRTDRSYLISSAPWIKIPYPFQWGTPIFAASHIFGMIGAVLVSACESTGAHYAAARLAGATPPPAYVLSRSVGLQGVGMLLESIFGAAAGSTVSIENVGLLGLTRVGSRRVVQISTGFMIFFSIIGKFGAFFASIPLPIFAAIYCILFGLVAAIGISFIQFANNNSLRNLYILGASLFLGISVPQYFNEFTASAGHGPAKTDAGWFNDILNSVFSSAPTVALMVAIVLDNRLEAKISYSDRGFSWLKPFNRHDARNEEFYSFPIKVHEWIPTRFID
ncbi:nucleobase-ascorbate transporter 3-like isoform X1 [Zingiber officinale]|uniref:nucleobase-ascorbate transporter 3-like isoform X1 n=1 Tax=Zingiber officinale TaxID=94328 RepID=UPI001C4DD3CF|nr:nucleobase-ascorbate transporter 3-like isoform X1 [Zingiber officinale]